MKTYLITGAGRGIGADITRLLLTRGDRVVGTLRDVSRVPPSLRAFLENGRLKVLQLDVRDTTSVARAAQAVDAPLDVLINNAGMIGPERQSTFDMDFEGFLDVLNVNILGPLRVAQAFLPHLQRSKHGRIVTISSRMGSLSYAMSDRIAYRASKAAVNKIVQGLATDLREKGIPVVCVHPGWVRTEMGGPQADISAAESAAGILALTDRLTLDDTGLFFDWRGSRLSF